jgi:hypothetical protein
MLSLPDGTSGDQWRSLHDWLGRETALRGRVELAESEPTPGRLGNGIVDVLTIGVSSGGAITVLVSGIVSWLRHVARQRPQPVPVSVTLKLPGGGMLKLETALVQAWSQAELRTQIADLAERAGGQLLAEDDLDEDDLDEDGLL